MKVRAQQVRSLPKFQLRPVRCEEVDKNIGALSFYEFGSHHVAGKFDPSSLTFLPGLALVCLMAVKSEHGLMLNLDRGWCIEKAH